ncbi:MAG TPA: hypothetical protein VMU60_03890 [Syntrophobacteria bacterium]|nr:hypothetical protein [Syntrophobacteria bacterium]
MNQLPTTPEQHGVGLFHSCPVDPACPYCNGLMDSDNAEAFDWSFLDGAYCISLKIREDRAASAATQFHRVGLCRHVLFYRPIKHPKSAKHGIWDSHRAVGEHARRRGCARTLIMEDDVLFSRRLRPHKVRALAQALDSLPPDWMIFFLGHWPLWAYFVRPDVLRTGSACAHAYIASSRLLQWLQDHPYGAPDVQKAPRVVGAGIDSAYARLAAAYALFPMIAIQSASQSDNMKDPSQAKKRKLRHLIRRSKHREWLLSHLMRPNELLIVMLSPLFFALRHAIHRSRAFGVSPEQLPRE